MTKPRRQEEMGKVKIPMGRPLKTHFKDFIGYFHKIKYWEGYPNVSNNKLSWCCHFQTQCFHFLQISASPEGVL